MARRLTVRDSGTAATGFNGSSGNDVTKASPTGVAFGTSTNFSVSFWCRTRQLITTRIIVGQRAGTNTASVGWVVGTSSTGAPFFEISDGTNEASNTLSGNKNISDNYWHHVVITFNRASVATIYVDGVVQTTTSITGVGDISTGITTNFRVGRDGSGNNIYSGSVDSVRVWSTLLTAPEVADLYYDGVVPQTASLKVEWLFNEGAGATANDTSGTGNNGTLTGVTFTSDSPMKKRSSVGASMLPNGDFELFPPFVAATATNARFIDGSAAGSTTNDIFTWSHNISSGGTTGTSSFDTTVKRSGGASLKVDCTVGAAATVTVGVSTTFTTPVNPTVLEQNRRMVRVLPSTSYTFSGYIKTSNIVTSGAGGARVRAIGYNGATTGSTETNQSSYMTGTNDWTLVTLTFTTAATTKFLNIWFQVDSSDVTTGTAWFDDFILTPTTNTTRSTATSRFLNRDFGTALKFVGNTGNVVTVTDTAALQLTTGFTVSAWAYLESRGGDTFKTIVCKGTTSAGGNRNYMLALNTTNLLLLSGYESSGGTNQFATGARVVPLHQWVHLLVTWDGTNVQCYQDGVADGSPLAASLTPLTTGGNLVFGTTTGQTAQEWDGLIDSVRIYSRALSATEISNLYSLGVVPTSQLVGEWMLNEGTGSTAVDSSGNANNGTITGATYTSQVRSINRPSV